MSDNRWANTGMHRLRELLFDARNTHDTSPLTIFNRFGSTCQFSKVKEFMKGSKFADGKDAMSTANG